MIGAQTERSKTMTELEVTAVEPLLKASDIAKTLNISKAMAYRLIQQREIPAVRINHAVRVRRSDLDAYIERCRDTGRAV